MKAEKKRGGGGGGSLVITRMIDEEVFIKDRAGNVLCIISIVELRRGKIGGGKLRFKAHPDIIVDRSEVHAKKLANPDGSLGA